jgi:VIT1/CCC1 family predicted Fe2+/Mn2+ transporter
MKTLMTALAFACIALAIVAATYATLSMFALAMSVARMVS